MRHELLIEFIEKNINISELLKKTITNEENDFIDHDTAHHLEGKIIAYQEIIDYIKNEMQQN